MKWNLKALFSIMGVFSLVAMPAFAHSENVSTSQYQLMRTMMGSESLTLSEEMEVEMMGVEDHERMEELMSKYFDGSLTVSERTEMIRIMEDPASGPGAQMMMSRTMTPFMMGNAGVISGGDVMGSMMGGNAIGSIAFVFWVTVVLFWILLILLIIAMLRWMLRDEKKPASRR